MSDLNEPQGPAGILGDNIEKIRQHLHVPPPRAQDKSQRPRNIMIMLVIEAIGLVCAIPLGERLGFSFPALAKLPANSTGAIWIHAVSVGEALSSVTLARRLKKPTHIAL